MNDAPNPLKDKSFKFALTVIQSYKILADQKKGICHE